MAARWTCTRLHASVKPQERVTKATAVDAVKLQRVIGYLAGTPELGNRSSGDSGGNATLTSFSDASFAVHGDMKSHKDQSQIIEQIALNTTLADR